MKEKNWLSLLKCSPWDGTITHSVWCPRWWALESYLIDKILDRGLLDYPHSLPHPWKPLGSVHCWLLTLRTSALRQSCSADALAIRCHNEVLCSLLLCGSTNSDAGHDVIDHLPINNHKEEVSYWRPAWLQTVGCISNHGMFSQQLAIFLLIDIPLYSVSSPTNEHV